MVASKHPEEMDCPVEKKLMNHDSIRKGSKAREKKRQ